MTERQEPTRVDEHATPMSLADSTVVDASPPDQSAARSSDETPESSRKKPSTTSASADSEPKGNKSTSFETVLGKLVVERGFITNEELSAARQQQRDGVESDQPKELVELLVENLFLTRRQVERLQREFEEDRSTQQIPGYKILRKLGSGAMATVFLGKQLSLDRLVAVKVLPTKFSSNEKFIERFYKEGRAAAQLNHRNIVGAYDVGQAGEHHYFVMEYVDGDTVYDRILGAKRLDEREATLIVRQVADALKHAHEKGFIHRDIKPKNIMMSRDGTVKLADLGLARAVSDKEAAEAEAGRAYGTPYYISPEQIRGEVKIGPPADIYGLGATFYHMVTGKVPFEGKNPSAVMHKHLKSALVPPDHINPKLNAGTAQVIEMMMSKSLSGRYRNVDDLLVDLDHIMKGEPPLFAGTKMDLSNIAKSVESSASHDPVRPPRSSKGGSMTDSPVFMSVVVLFILSVVINVILMLLLALG